MTAQHVEVIEAWAVRRGDLLIPEDYDTDLRPSDYDTAAGVHLRTLISHGGSRTFELVDGEELTCDEDKLIMVVRPGWVHWINGSGGHAVCGEPLAANLASRTQAVDVTCPTCRERMVF